MSKQKQTTVRRNVKILEMLPEDATDDTRTAAIVFDENVLRVLISCVSICLHMCEMLGEEKAAQGETHYVLDGLTKLRDDAFPPKTATK